MTGTQREQLPIVWMSVCQSHVNMNINGMKQNTKLAVQERGNAKKS